MSFRESAVLRGGEFGAMMGSDRKDPMVGCNMVEATRTEVCVAGRLLGEDDVSKAKDQ